MAVHRGGSALCVATRYIHFILYSRSVNRNRTATDFSSVSLDQYTVFVSREGVNTKTCGVVCFV